MSFASQISVCRDDTNADITPTEQEIHLSRLRRPGFRGDCRIKQILNPGRYAFDPARAWSWIPTDRQAPDVADKRADVVRQPKRVRIKNVSWHQSKELNWTAYLSTKSKKISVPVDFADDAGLGYYNCRLISPDDVITLNHRSIITNFRYHKNYFRSYVLGVLGCSSIEQHEFAHVDKPLNKRSGYLVLGGMDPIDQSLELTAFVVEPMQSVYIPARTIHTNDYFLGTWETLLSSSCEFPSAQMKHSGNEPLQFVYEINFPTFTVVD